jgi:hypothetical protein
MSGRNFGQEITLNDWQIGWQNFLKLLLLSIAIGLVIAIIWWSLFAPPDAFRAVNLYWYSWLYCRIPAGCSPTAIYNLQVLQPTINRLGGVWQGCTYVFAIATFVSAFVLRQLFVKRGDNLSETKFLRGARLLSPETLKREIAQDFSESIFDLKLGTSAVLIPEDLTYRHLCFVGASGTGKTQAINSVLQQLFEIPRQKGIVLDLNGQYYSRFGRPQDKILSLYDKRTQPWSFWTEYAQPEFFAEALIEESKDDKFWAAAGRALLTDLLSRNQHLRDLWNDLISPPEVLVPKLAGGLSPALLGSDKQAAGVISTASLKLAFLEILNYWCKPEQAHFSITDWAVNQDETWVFLIVRDQDLSASKPLLRTWVDLATLGVLQRDENNDYPHLWVIADELPGLGKLPSLGKLLSQGRKYKGTVIAGYQTTGQIEDLWGKDGAKEIFQGFQAKLIYRCSDSDTAKRSSAELGEQEIEEITMSTQFGTATSSDRNTLNRPVKTRPVVMPAELQNLGDLRAYTKIVKFDPCLIKFAYQKYSAINQATDCEIPTPRRYVPISQSPVETVTGNEMEDSYGVGLIPEEELEGHSYDDLEAHYDYDPDSIY